jgi:hypothetical protein
LQLVVGALDRALDHLAVKRSVDDDRAPALELDQHAGGAHLVDVRLGEADRRRPVGVAVELPMQGLRLRVQLLALLAEPELGDRVRARGVQVGGEGLVTGLAHCGVEYPAGLAGKALGGPRIAVVQVGDHGVQQRRRDGADCAQLVDGRQRDHALADHLLSPFGRLEDLHARGHAALRPAERLGGAVRGQPAVEHRADGLGLLVRVQLLARDVLHRAVGVLGRGVADDERHLGQAERPRRGDPVKARDELEAVALAAHDDRDEHALKLDRPGQRLDVRLIDRAHVVRHADPLERDLMPGLFGDCGHVVLLLPAARPAGAPIPAHPHARQGVPSSGGGSARQRQPSSLARIAS